MLNDFEELDSDFKLVVLELHNKFDASVDCLLSTTPLLTSNFDTFSLFFLLLVLSNWGMVIGTSSILTLASCGFISSILIKFLVPLLLLLWLFKDFDLLKDEALVMGGGVHFLGGGGLIPDKILPCLNSKKKKCLKIMKWHIGNMYPSLRINTSFY